MCKTCKNKKSTIYIAYLKNGKRYVGHTSNYKYRVWQHFNGLGSRVTQENRPIYIKKIKTVPRRYGKWEELKLARQQTRRFGSDRVRGGYAEHPFNY